ncbi:hypothetical protein GQR58_017295 [Nymphon striatum]|nr:hypothetical protein GQR58_017295 [Nymphon striatum]
MNILCLMVLKVSQALNPWAKQIHISENDSITPTEDNPLESSTISRNGNDTDSITLTEELNRKTQAASQLNRENIVKSSANYDKIIVLKPYEQINYTGIFWHNGKTSMTAIVGFMMRCVFFLVASEFLTDNTFVTFVSAFVTFVSIRKASQTNNEPEADSLHYLYQLRSRHQIFVTFVRKWQGIGNVATRKALVSIRNIFVRRGRGVTEMKIFTIQSQFLGEFYANFKYSYSQHSISGVTGKPGTIWICTRMPWFVSRTIPQIECITWVKVIKLINCGKALIIELRSIGIIARGDHKGSTNLHQKFPISYLQYADDLVLISSSSKDLQVAIDSLAQYCDNNNLTVNTDKTKCLSSTPHVEHILAKASSRISYLRIKIPIRDLPLSSYQFPLAFLALNSTLLSFHTHKFPTPILTLFQLSLPGFGSPVPFLIFPPINTQDELSAMILSIFFMLDFVPTKYSIHLLLHRAAAHIVLLLQSQMQASAPSATSNLGQPSQKEDIFIEDTSHKMCQPKVKYCNTMKMYKKESLNCVLKIYQAKYYMNSVFTELTGDAPLLKIFDDRPSAKLETGKVGEIVEDKRRCRYFSAGLVCSIQLRATRKINLWHTSAVHRTIWELYSGRRLKLRFVPASLMYHNNGKT